MRPVLLLQCAVVAMVSAEDLLFIDIPKNAWNNTLIQISLIHNSSAVHNYMDMLAKGWLGQAIRERYAFDGQVEKNASGIEVVGYNNLPIDELVIEHLQGYLEEDDDRLAATNKTLRAALSETEDPGHNLLQAMVDLMDTYQPDTDVQKRAKYTPRCKTKARAKRSDCQEAFALASRGTGYLDSDFSGYEGTCYIRAPGTKTMTVKKFISIAGLIISDCAYVPSGSTTVYVQGHVRKSSSRRKVCVQVESTNC
ncbi:hypothetical protein EDB81DRAFT_761312 [Dactylonectria macrodidyma]|uniref:Uncharacterized protein n=1 Tax=Dactylonectria macrodidyma TaxID=307937 RepID=A0A9P9EMI7_9HYPO|nr:hypothetical protein EDB81DRAFT_761312 [Dactylonectria macrodidyma]